MAGRRRTERTGFELYGTAVAAARDPWLYTVIEVPDTLDGRFDMVGLHSWLLIRNLGKHPAPGPALGQAVFDAMFSDMDVNLREMGVGDLSVGKRVKAMWEAFHGRATAYESALSEADPEAFAEALRRNVWRGDAQAPVAGSLQLAHRSFAQDAALAAGGLALFTQGKAGFLPPVREPVIHG